MRDTQDTYVLSFPDQGLEIAATVTSMAAAEAVERMDRRITSGLPVRIKDIVRLAEVFVRHVERWNLRTYTGVPTPITADAFLMRHRNHVVMPVLRQWVALVRNPQPAPPADEASEPEPADERTYAGVPLSDIENMLGAQTLTPPTEDELPVQEDEAPSVEPVGASEFVTVPVG